jgi:hypothetical protein
MIPQLYSDMSTQHAGGFFTGRWKRDEKVEAGSRFDGETGQGKNCAYCPLILPCPISSSFSVTHLPSSRY